MHDLLKRLNELHAGDLRALDAHGLRRFEALCEQWARLSESELARRNSLPRGDQHVIIRTKS
jgi:hypothetical protein